MYLDIQQNECTKKIKATYNFERREYDLLLEFIRVQAHITWQQYVICSILAFDYPSL